jgi:ribonucleoside-diphosphate reductase subunit M1
MYMSKPPQTNQTSNGIPTPSTTPPPTETAKLPPVTKSPFKTPAFKADVEEGDSPKALATEPSPLPPKEEQLLPDPAIKLKNQEEDADSDSAEREHDIYAEAVLACELIFL